jgi:hypothetical protein
VVRTDFVCHLTHRKTSIRYAKNSSGQVGVIPENYVQALADPPEPNEPPPPLSSFSSSNHSMYPSMDTHHNNANTSRSSIQSNVEPPLYMNPNAANNWPAPDLPAWSPAQRPVRYPDECLFDAFVVSCLSESFFTPCHLS